MPRPLLPILGLALCAGAPSWGRQTRPLTEWRFRLDPERVGLAERWFAESLGQARPIRVPGSWDVQGFGEPTPFVKHNHVGWGWYEVTIPPGPLLGERTWLCFGAVHRSAKVWVNGQPVGEHLGYVTAFEFDISDAYRREAPSRITVLVDSEQHVEVDGLAGCYDTYDFTKWGGLHGGVRIEGRAESWVRNLFVRAEAGCTRARVTAEVVGPAAGLSARCTLQSRAGGHDFGGEAAVTDGRLEIVLQTPDAELWSPNHPNLYTATLELLRGGRVVDTLSTRVGLREIEVRGSDVYLNGKRTFLRGYGDDACFPETVCPPAEVAYWRKRFLRAREYGFTYVRHHSHVPVQEYFDAADETGFLIQPELPIAYEPHIANATPAALDLFRSQWRDMVLQYRNHPSVITWCMGNEMGTPNVLAEELCDTAKTLDRTRLVCDSDGLWGAWDNPVNLRRTLDLIHLQFDEWSIPWGDRRGKYELAGSPPKPVMIHEMSNFVAFYDVRDAERYRGLVKPAWLTGEATPGPEPYPSHREADARMWYVRQLGKPWELEWETEPVPAHSADRVVFVWTAATGFLTEPSGRFTLHLNERPLITFDCAEEARSVWRSKDGRSELIFDVRQLGIDQLGVMYLVVPAELAPIGQPARLQVTASAANSRRWFAVYDYRDTLRHERRAGAVLDLPGTQLVEGLKGAPRWTRGDAGSVLGAARQQGTVDLLPTFVENSRKLQALCLKLNLEAARRSREVDGYSQWLLIDYWQGGQGVLNQYYEPKALSAEEFRRFNGETVVLLDRDGCSLTAGDILDATALVSHFGEADLTDPSLELAWTTPEASPRVLAERRWEQLPAVAAGSVAELRKLSLRAPGVERPVRSRLTLNLRSGDASWSNAWDYALFPPPQPWADPQRVGLVGGAAFATLYPDARQLPAVDLPTDGPELLVAGTLTAGLLDRLAAGRSVLLLANGQAPGERLRFKSPWWFPGPGDSNLGTIIRSHPAVEGFPHEGWCDLPWFDLVQDATALVHDGPLSAVPPIIQAIDLPLRQQTRSLLWEARVGQGRLLVTTLDLTSELIARDPAARCLFDGLVAYARSGRFAPSATLTPAQVATCLAPDADLRSPTLEGFGRLVSAAPDPHSRQTSGAPAVEAAWWGEPCRTWIARQRDGGGSVTWETQSVPRQFEGDTVTFAWSGKLGWPTEPEGGFTLALEGSPTLRFDVTSQAAHWTSDDGQVRLEFQPRGLLGGDSGGIFRLTMPRDRVRPGQPLQLTVSGGSGSMRWFGLHEDSATLSRTFGLR